MTHSPSPSLADEKGDLGSDLNIGVPSEGTLLYVEPFNRGEAGENEKSFHKAAGTEEKDIQQSEDREALEVLRAVQSSLEEGGCLSFLGSDIRLNRNREGKSYVSKTPRMKKRKEIGRKVMLKAHHDKPLKEVIQAVNAVVRGRVNYFRIGNSNDTFGKVKYFLEKKVRWFVMRRKGRKGFGWKRWSREDIYKKWGLYNDYQMRYLYPKATPVR